jgi:rfaE bifunctional protein kinase chain/domain
MSLTSQQLETILASVPKRTIGVLGDLFLDRYFDLDGQRTEPSLETGLDAYQVTQVRSIPGAAGTVINNLVALGVGRVVALSLIGEDGEGFELLRALSHQGVCIDGIVRHPSRLTPTYMKPMLRMPGQLPRELHRLDIHPCEPLDTATQDQLLENLRFWLPRLDALAIVDQVKTLDAGVVTSRLREHLALFPATIPILADSRFRISHFRSVMLKPNEAEARSAVPQAPDALAAADVLAMQASRPVYLTLGSQGIYCVEPGQRGQMIPAYRVDGPTDPVGAGDSTTAGILTALVAGLSPREAAAFGCLVASITVSKIGTTGVASPAELRVQLQKANSSENS